MPTHTCITCGYTTERHDAYVRHLKKKNPCVPGSNALPPPLQTRVPQVVEAPPLVPDPVVTPPPPNEGCLVVDINDEEVDENSKVFKCLNPKCTKTFTRKYTMMKHFEKCNGCLTLQCPTCFEIFEKSVAKYRHKDRKSVV